MNIRKISLLAFVFIAFLLIGSAVLEHGAVIDVHASGGGMFNEVENGMDPGIPTVTTDDVSEWTDRKGFEIIGLLQKFIQPFAIIVFIGCAILTLVGAFGNGRMVSRGIVGMLISLIMYVVVLYAPEIMDVFLDWTRT